MSLSLFFYLISKQYSLNLKTIKMCFIIFVLVLTYHHQWSLIVTTIITDHCQTLSTTTLITFDPIFDLRNQMPSEPTFFNHSNTSFDLRNHAPSDHLGRAQGGSKLDSLL